MGNPDATNRCDREIPDCRPRGIGRDCWTPKEMAKYGLDPADFAPEECARRLYANFLYEWNDCMSGCYTNSYGTQPLDESDRRQLESKKKKKKEDRDTDGDGVPDKLDEDIDGDGKTNEEDRDPFSDESKAEDKEDTDFPDTDPNVDGPVRRRPKRGDKEVFDTSTTSWRIVTICKAYCARVIKLDYTECFCDRVKCGPEDDEPESTFDTNPVDEPVTDPVQPALPDDETPPKRDKQKLNVTDSAYGVPIEIIWGQHRAAGNIFWIAPTRREERVSVRTLAFGSATTATGASTITTPVIDFAVGICAPEIDAVTRIYFNDYLFYDANSAYSRVGTFNNGDKSGVSNGDELIKGMMFFYRGGEAQKFARELIQDGEYPIGYRDMSFLVFRGLDLRAIGNKFPSLRIEVASEVTTEVTEVTATPTVAPVSARGFSYNKIFVDEGQPGAYKVLTTEGDILYNVSGQTFDASSAVMISDQYVATRRGSVIESRSLASGAVLSTYASPISDLAAHGAKSFYARARTAPGMMATYFIVYEAPNVHFHPVAFAKGLYGARTSVSIGSGVFGGVFASYFNTDAKSATESAVFVKYDGALKLVEFTLASTDGGAGFVFNPSRPPSETKITGGETFISAFTATSIAFDSVNALVILGGRVGTKYAAIAIDLRTKTTAWAIKYDFNAPLNPVWHGAVGGLNGVMNVCDGLTGYTIDTRTGTILKQTGVTVTGDHFLTSSSGAVLQALGTNTLEAINLSGVVADTVAVADIAYDITRRAKLNPANVIASAIDRVLGYKVDTNSPAKTFLSELATVVGVAVFDDGERLRIANYSPADYPIDEEDFGEVTGGRFQLKIRDTAVRPATQTVTYYDASNGLKSSTVTVRPDAAGVFAVGDDATFDTNVVLGSYDAILLAERLAATILIADNVAELSLGPKHLLLTPNDQVLSASSLFGNASFLARTVTVGADKTSRVEMKLYALDMYAPNPVVPPIPTPPVLPTPPLDDAGTPIIIQAKPASYADVPDSPSNIAFYGGLVGNIGESAMLFYLNGAYIDRAEVSKPLTMGIVTSTSNDARPDTAGPQWEPDDLLTVVFDSPPDTSVWYQAGDLNDITSSSLIANLLLVGREWMQFRSYEVAMDGITVTFRDIVRGLRGTDAYIDDTMLGRQVYVYDEAAWGRFEISKSSASLYPATLVSRSLSNEAAAPEVTQAIISQEPSFNWAVARLRLKRDMLTDFISLTWNVRSRFNGPMDNAWWFEIPGITTPTEFFVVKDDVTLESLRNGVTEVFSEPFDWGPTKFVRAYAAVQDEFATLTVGTFTTLGIDYFTEKFHIILRQADNSINPTPSGHYLVATFDPSINTDHITGRMVEPTNYQVITIP